MELDAHAARGLDRGLETMRAEFDGRLPGSVIDQVVSEALARFSSARVEVYVPIFVVRSARARLREMSRADVLGEDQARAAPRETRGRIRSGVGNVSRSDSHRRLFEVH